LRLRMHPGSGRNGRDSVGHEDSSAACPRMQSSKASRGVIIDPAAVAGFGVTRRRSGGNARGCEIRGNSEIQPLAQPRAGIRGNPETCRRQCRKMRDLGRPKASSEAGREERGRGATRGFARPAPLKDARFGETRRSIAGRAGRCRARGNSGPHQQGGAGEAEMRGNPELRLDGAAEGCEIRGNSKIHRRHSEKMRDARKLAASSER